MLTSIIAIVIIIFFFFTKKELKKNRWYYSDSFGISTHKNSLLSQKVASFWKLTIFIFKFVQKARFSFLIVHSPTFWQLPRWPFAPCQCRHPLNAPQLTLLSCQSRHGRLCLTTTKSGGVSSMSHVRDSRSTVIGVISASASRLRSRPSRT